MTTKNETIKATLKVTKEKRKHQFCRVYETKLDSSHLNQETQEHLNRLFLEAKWFYNHILSQRQSPLPLGRGLFREEQDIRKENG